MKKYISLAVLLLVSVFLSSCGRQVQFPESQISIREELQKLDENNTAGQDIVEGIENIQVPETITRQYINFEKKGFTALKGYEYDTMDGAIRVAKQSCSRFLQKSNANFSTQFIAFTASDMQIPCLSLDSIYGETGFKKWLQEYFDVWRVTDSQNNDMGTFTGYFETVLQGSLKKTSVYKYPIYGIPNDMVYSAKWNKKGYKNGLKGRVTSKKFVPYYTRGQINEREIDAPVLIWAKDPIDVFILHIQGSGKVRLPTGQVVRLGYAGNNGYKYKSMGQALIQKGYMQLKDANWPNIKKWIQNNPRKSKKMLAVNPRYIFFKVLKGEDKGPIGKMGVGLTDRRSLAVDYTIFPMGLGVWLDASGVGDIDVIRRYMHIQDTGSAIKGPIRGDFYWGTGKSALKYAGKMKSKGSYYLFLPKTVKPNKKYIME